MTIKFNGSEKQIKWAQDIMDGAFGQLESMDRNADNEFLGVNYTHEDVAEVRKYVQDVFSQMQDAHMVIDKRNMFHWSALEKLASNIKRDCMMYDTESHKFVERTKPSDEQVARAEEIRTAVYNKLDEMAAESEDVAAQVAEVRKFCDDVFSQPAMTTGRIIAKRDFFTGYAISKMVKDTLRDGATYDPSTHQWSK